MGRPIGGRRCSTQGFPQLFQRFWLRTLGNSRPEYVAARDGDLPQSMQIGHIDPEQVMPSRSHARGARCDTQAVTRLSKYGGTLAEPVRVGTTRKER